MRHLEIARQNIMVFQTAQRELRPPVVDRMSGMGGRELGLSLPKGSCRAAIGCSPFFAAFARERIGRRAQQLPRKRQSVQRHEPHAFRIVHLDLLTRRRQPPHLLVNTENNYGVTRSVSDDHITARWIKPEILRKFAM